MSTAGNMFDPDLSDEDLDLTDTKLLVHSSDDDEELKKYIDLPGKVTSPESKFKAEGVTSTDVQSVTLQDVQIVKSENLEIVTLADDEIVTLADGNFIESFKFKPLTSASIKTEEKIIVTSKDTPIVLLSDSDSDVVEIDLSLHCSTHSDLPDYESPVEDDGTDVKHSSPNKVNQDSPDDIKYNELLEICGEVVDYVDNSMEYDNDDDDSNDYTSGMTPGKTKTLYRRKSPYDIKDRVKYVKGKGKQPVSGGCRFKSSSNRQTSPGASSSDQDVVCVDSGTPICFGDGPVDLNLANIEDKPLIPPPPFVCEACEKETSHNSMVQCCDGHMVCMRCVETSAKKVLVGEKKGSVECPYTDCTSSVPLSELRKALPAIVLDLLEDKWNKETMEALENMKDAVKCPGCNFPAVLDLTLKRFQCVQCNEAYCRYCDRKWTERKTHDLCIRTKQWTSTVTGNVVNIPAQWSEHDTTSSDGKTESHTIVELDPSSAEFCDVVHFMNKQMSSTVKKIFRVQNERLWEKYSLSRSHMVADLGELNINEKRLFHGTHSDVIEAICKEGFDWRLCGKHGTVYGQGTYFAKSPVLSHRYSSGNLARRVGNPTRVPGSSSGFFFGSSRPSSHYRPPLRFGAPSTTQSGFTLAAQGNTTATNFGFTFGQNRTVNAGNFGFGSQFGGTSQPTCSSGFTFGSTAASTPVTCNLHQVTTTGHNSVFRFTATNNSTPSSHPKGSHSSHSNSSIPSTTSSHHSSAIKTSCSNCIFCSPKRKGNDTSATTAVVSQTTTSNPGITTAPQSLQAVLDNLTKSQIRGGARFFVRPVPPSPTITGTSGSSVRNSLTITGSNVGNLTFGESNVNSGSFFPLNKSTGSSSHIVGSTVSLNAARHGSGGFVSGNFGRSGLNLDASSDNDCFMFLARVLVGRSCLGTHEMRRPQKEFSGLETHSAVDDKNKPKIFVIFDNNQCYPEYIIQYSTSHSI